MKRILPLVLLFLFAACETYDNALIYHKNFQPGTHPLLRFDGYYSDTLSPKNSSGAKKPVFFYENGSAFSATSYTPADELKNIVPNNRIAGAWGNYLITGDTIRLEKFQLEESNYARIILKGIILKDEIHWTARKEHNEDFKPVDYSVFFTSFPSRPNVAKNFTRTKEKYNK